MGYYSLNSSKIDETSRPDDVKLHDDRCNRIGCGKCPPRALYAPGRSARYNMAGNHALVLSRKPQALMKSSSPVSLILAAASGFALGAAAGLLFAPQSGDKLRARIADEAREQVRQAEARLKEMDARFRALESRLTAAGQDVTRRVRTAAEQARDTVIPTIDTAAEAARIDEKELAQDLRHMTRR